MHHRTKHPRWPAAVGRERCLMSWPLVAIRAPGLKLERKKQKRRDCIQTAELTWHRANVAHQGVPNGRMATEAARLSGKNLMKEEKQKTAS